MGNELRSHSAIGNTSIAPSTSLLKKGKRDSSLAAFRSPAHRLAPSIIPSLHALCLGVLADYLEELVEYGESVLPLLPAAAKASLLAAARRRSLLTNDALRLLADPEHTSLDVHTLEGSPLLTPASILTAAREIGPSLLYIDLTGIGFKPRFLTSLAAVAPRIQVLRFGKFPPNVDAEDMGYALLGILPKLEQGTVGIVDSWEEAAEESTHDAPQGRLMRLRCVLWPEIPFEIKQMCLEVAPALSINPSAAEIKAKKLPPESSARCELDGELAAGVAGQEAWELEAQRRKGEKGQEAPPPVIHIAERFRMAYESQDKRLKKRDEWLWRKATRETLKSGAERAIHEWEDGF